MSCDQKIYLNHEFISINLCEVVNLVTINYLLLLVNCYQILLLVIKFIS